MRWVKGNNHIYYSRDGKIKFNMILWAYVDAFNNTMYQIYKPIGEVPTTKD